MENKTFIKRLTNFLLDCTREIFTGSKTYWIWLGCLAAVAGLGAVAYGFQLQNGLVTSGMSDQVSWGIYIANFTFLVGLAAAAVMLVIPAYIFHNKSAKHVVLLGEGVAVAACIMCMLFVTVDLGRPDRILHLLPFIGRFNWPASMLAWDMVVLSGYLVLNLSIPAYVLYNKYQGHEPETKKYFPAVLIAIFWAISIHTVTAFLLSSNTARPFWHTALLGPRFLASAFTAGPAFMIIAFRIIDAKTEFKVEESSIRLLAVITAVALQINLFMLGSEIFTEFYSETSHAASAHYLFKGIGDANGLLPWIYTAITIEIFALVILMVNPFRENKMLLGIASVFAICGVWVEKGMGLVIPGFIPTPLGEIFEYTPSGVEILVSLGIWAIGFIVLTVLAKAAIPIETGRLKTKSALPAAE